MFPWLNLYYADPAQYLKTVGSYLDDLDRELSDLSVRRVKYLRRIVSHPPPSPSALTTKKALKNQWEAEVRKTHFDGKLGATLSTKLAVVGLGGMGNTLAGAARGARGASLLMAFEKAVMRLWPAFCHIDAQRRSVDGGGVGE